MPRAFGYELRQATNQDGEQIRGLIARVLSEYGIGTCASTTERDLVDIETSYRTAGGDFYVLMDGATVIGTVALHRESAAVGELCRMYLDRPYRGRGLGRRLFELAIDLAESLGFSELRLETASVLTQAIALYESAGFTRSGETPTGSNCNVVM